MRCADDGEVDPRFAEGQELVVLQLPERGCLAEQGVLAAPEEGVAADQGRCR